MSRNSCRLIRVGVAAVAAVGLIGCGPSSEPAPASLAPTPAASGSANPNPSVTPVSAVPAVAGAGGLADATITLDWSFWGSGICESGPVTFTGGRQLSSAGTSEQGISQVVPADVDQDGRPELVALVWCDSAAAGEHQLVAVSTDSGFRTLGPVVADRRGIAGIRSFVALSDGGLQVQVEDRFTCEPCYIPAGFGVAQWRTYRWSGGAFVQSAGPTTFTADPAYAGVEVTSVDLSLSEPVDGWRTGALRLRVTNSGAEAAPAVSLFLSFYVSFVTTSTSGGDWTACTPFDLLAPVCVIGDLATGATKTLALPFRWHDRPNLRIDPGEALGDTSLRIGDHRLTYGVQFYMA